MSQSLSKLLELNPIHLPDAPSWWPLAWGWLSLTGVVFLATLIVILVIRWRIKRLIPKKAALKMLTAKHGRMTPSDAIELVRQAAFCYYSRQDIAHLTGNDWYSFLDTQYGKPLFVPDANLWQAVLYQHKKVDSGDESQMIENCVAWVEESLPPKKNRR
ncbi:DUF4381 domain-containing protein [Vibrio sp.]|nr:DUF4381 domain-containing protein [Vibrio sp.]